jgi:hypothetical protein
MGMKFGLVGSTSGAGSSRQNNNLENKISNAQGKVVAARVIDIVLNEKHQYYNLVGEWNGIGAIFYEIVNKSGTKSYPNFALPYDAQLKTYPLINEIVLLISLPNQSMGFVSSNESYFYMSPLGIWNHPHHNAYPNLLDGLNDEEQTRDYPSSTSGSVRRVTDGSTEIDLNSSNPSQNTFPEKEKEKTNIHPLLPFMGDSLLEGRYGQSLRFGSTARSNFNFPTEIQNNWSDSGENGDPITILRNGQPTKTSDEGWVPITENIRYDQSSIYLTSTQKLKDFKVSSELYQSYAVEPIKPSDFTKPQVAINSNRVVINASSDSILLSAQTSIGMTTNGSVNIDATSHYISSNDIRLGSKNATQPVLLGNETIDIMLELSYAIRSLANMLQVQRDYPEGVLKTSFNSIAGSVITCLDGADGIINRLLNGSLKSQTTKVQ